MQNKGKDNSRFLNRAGEIYKNNNGEDFEIIEYINALNCTIRFMDVNKYVIKNVSYKRIELGKIKNPFALSVFGIGFYGGDTKNKSKLSINRWRYLLARCYHTKTKEKRPTYNDVTVCEEWHNFQNFAKWFEENNEPHMQDWHLDKDILVKGNKIYSPETCCFVPHEINSLFNIQEVRRGSLPSSVTQIKNSMKYRSMIHIYGKTFHLGVFCTSEEAFYAYKIVKEAHIKEVADLWRGQITEPCYEAMYAYQVEITD